MKMWIHNRDSWARLILLVLAVPILSVTSIKCYLLNPARPPENFWIDMLQQGWLVRWELWQAGLLATASIMLVFMKKNYGYWGVLALLVSMALFFATPVWVR